MVGFTASVSVLTLVCCISTILGFIVHVVSFATNRWLESTSLSPFLSIGFHQACLTNCRHPYCPGGDPSIVYDGCYHWTFNPYIWDDERFREIRTWLMPVWYVDIRNLCIANIPISFVALLLAIICVALALADRLTTTENTCKDKVLCALLFINGGLLLVVFSLATVVVGQFYYNAFRLDWMPMPEKNSMGFSLWLEVAAAVFFGVAFFASTLAGIFKAMRMAQPKDPRYSEEMMLGRAPQPATRPRGLQLTY